MRRCPRSDEVLQALAVEEPLAPVLAAHVAACANCTKARAAARRFDARLDTAVADLVTDALPPTTAMAARTAPHATRRRSTPGTLASTLLAGAFVVFAVVGVVATGASISDAMRSGSAAGPEATEPDLDRVDCYIGNAIVVVTGELVEDAGPEGEVAHCVGVEPSIADRGAAMICAESRARAAAARKAREAAGAGDAGGHNSLACALVEDADGSDRTIEADKPPLPSSQFDTWDEAAEATSWPVLRPGWLPDGYQLVALQGFSASNDQGAVDSLVATYLRNGVPLSFDQFQVADPDDPVELNLPGSEISMVSAGQTTVGDHPAFWAEGVAGSDVHALVLSWNDGGVGYQVTARNEDLEVVERIAESLTDR